MRQSLRTHWIPLFLAFFALVALLSATPVLAGPPHPGDGKPPMAGDGKHPGPGGPMKQALADVVHSTALGLGGALADVSGEEAQVKLVRAFVDKARFLPDQSGYFFVYDMNGKNVAHATQKELQGTDLSNLQDEKGQYVIRNLAALAAKGGGFLEFYWAKPGKTGTFLKLGYVEPIPGTSWFIGSGLYAPEAK